MWQFKSQVLCKIHGALNSGGKVLVSTKYLILDKQEVVLQ
jgi:hypothetical protein